MKVINHSPLFRSVVTSSGKKIYITLQEFVKRRILFLECDHWKDVRSLTIELDDSDNFFPRHFKSSYEISDIEIWSWRHFDLVERIMKLYEDYTNSMRLNSKMERFANKEIEKL